MAYKDLWDDIYLHGTAALERLVTPNDNDVILAFGNNGAGAAKRLDLTFYGSTSSKHWKLDASADTLTSTALTFTYGAASTPSSTTGATGTAQTTQIAATGGVGGASTNASGTGGIGGGFSFTGGAGGVASGATAATGGAGGAWAVTTGAGGAISSTTTTIVGGAGGDITSVTGAGGAASGAATTSTAGASGAVSIASGTGGATSGAVSGTATGGASGDMTFASGTGGATTATTGTNVGGASGNLSVVSGTGGAASGATDTGGASGTATYGSGVGGAGDTGGASGAVVIKSGTGGAGTGTGGASGNVTLRTGAAGSGGSPTVGSILFEPGAVEMGRITGLKFFIGDTTDANITQGICLNQGAADDKIMSFKSSDVAHSATTLAETDSYGTIGKHEATTGGLYITGFKDGDGSVLGNAVVIEGVLDEAAADTTKSTAAVGIVNVICSIEAGNTRGATGADGNLFVVQDGALATKCIIDAEGSQHGDAAAATYDEHDDLALVRAYDQDKAGYVRSRWDSFVRATKDTLRELKILGTTKGLPGERPLVNFTKLTQLHNGALWQLCSDLMDVVAALPAEIQAKLPQKFRDRLLALPSA